MKNWKFITGPFEGEIVEEGTQVLDVDFHQLDEDLQCRIRYWAEGELGEEYIEVDGGANYYARKGGPGLPLSMNEIKNDYENSWQAEETDEEVTLIRRNSEKNGRPCISGSVGCYRL